MTWREVWRLQREQRILMHALPEVGQIKASALAMNDKLIEALEDLEFELGEKQLDLEHYRSQSDWLRGQLKKVESSQECAK